MNLNVLKITSFVFLFLLLLACKKNTKQGTSSIHSLDSLDIFANGYQKGRCIEGNCINGKGKYELDKGSVYDGSFQNGKAHGNGLFSMPDGYFKEGEWQEGRLIKGKEYNNFDSLLYTGRFVPLIGIDSFSSFDVPHGIGQVQYKEKGLITVEYDSGELVSVGNMKYIPFYADKAISCVEVEKSDKHKLRKKPSFDAVLKRKYSLDDFSAIRLFGTPYPYGIKGIGRHEVLSGKIIRAIRFQNITAAVERKYGLPQNILLAMIMIESSGRRYLPNARDDGGIGLAHMQGIVANEFGLNTVCNESCGLVCKQHGKFLRKKINEYNWDYAPPKFGI